MKYLLLITSLLLAASCNRPSVHGRDAADRDTIAILTEHYDDDVYDQRRTEGCWIYAMLACIEHEAKRNGDSVLLSRQWLMARLMEEQTLERYIMKTQSASAFSSRLLRGDVGRRLSMRGVGPDAIRLIETYGMVPYQHERSRINNSRVLERKLTMAADRMAAQHRSISLSDFRSELKNLLPRFSISDNSSGELCLSRGLSKGREPTVIQQPSPNNQHPTTVTQQPSTITQHPTTITQQPSPTFYYLSMRYTPLEFAESIMYRQQWQWYASSQYHPYNTVFALEVPDNRRYHEYMNLPMSEIEARVIASLKAGHAVYWEKSNRRDTGASDHAMAIVGLISPSSSDTTTHSTHGKGEDKKTPAFLCLNSYGKGWGRNGYCTVSLKYFRHHTSNVGIVEE